MTLQQLKYIIGVSEIGSLNKASEALYVSQPSLTAAIKDVENEFDITIFNRSSRGISLTQEGKEFLQYARQIYAQYESLMEKYGQGGMRKKKFGVSTQHYSFAVKSFVEMVKKFNTDEYEFSINETRTLSVIDDVATGRSEIGILYLSDFNRKVLLKLLHQNDLVFEPLIICDAYVYLYKKHPLAKAKSISFDQLKDYPCLTFDQGNSSFYFAEEILTENEYPKIIKTTDRATNLNLMIGLNGYTLCSGIICEELNGEDFVAVPYEADAENPNSKMEIGYIVKKNVVMSKTGEAYVEEIKKYLSKVRQ